MSHDISTAKLRYVEKLGIKTPLLVPSFSSRGFPGIGGIVNALRVDISTVCLLSAFDINNGHAPPNFDELADIIIIDSGVYETSPGAVAVDASLPHCAGQQWRREQYRDFLNASARRMALTNTIIVSYDEYTHVDEQVRLAKADFALAPDAATDFLLKPDIPGRSYKSLKTIGDMVSLFDVVGVTERELGDCALSRCRSLLELRAALDKTGRMIPIHVFGAITPAAITAYFLCGADIFDGLNWLRVSLCGFWARTPSEFAVTNGMFDISDHNVMLEMWRQNLNTLQKIQHTLRQFGEDGNRAALCISLPFATHSLALADRATQLGAQ